MEIGLTPAHLALRMAVEALWIDRLKDEPDAIESCRGVSRGITDAFERAYGGLTPGAHTHEMVQATIHSSEALWESIEKKLRSLGKEGGGPIPELPR